MIGLGTGSGAKRFRVGAGAGARTAREDLPPARALFTLVMSILGAGGAPSYSSSELMLLRSKNSPSSSDGGAR